MTIYVRRALFSYAIRQVYIERYGVKFTRIISVYIVDLTVFFMRRIPLELLLRKSRILRVPLLLWVALRRIALWISLRSVSFWSVAWLRIALWLAELLLWWLLKLLLLLLWISTVLSWIVGRPFGRLFFPFQEAKESHILNTLGKV